MPYPGPTPDLTPRDEDGNPIEGGWGEHRYPGSVGVDPLDALTRAPTPGAPAGAATGAVTDEIRGGTPASYLGMSRDPIGITDADLANEAERIANGDILNQQWTRWREEAGGIRGAAMDDAGAYADDLNSMAGAYGDELKGSDAYASLQGYGDEMRGVYEAGGLTDVTKANLERTRREEDQWLRGQREASLQDLAERGMTGGGSELLSSIGARSAAADRMSARGLDTNAFAQEQAMQALQAANSSDREMYGMDKDISDTQLDYSAQGANTKYGVADAFTNSAMTVWNDLMSNAIDQGAGLWQQAARDASGAAQGAKGTLANASADGRSNAANAIASGTAQLGVAGDALWGPASMAPPTLNTLSPPVPNAPPLDVSADIGTLATVIGNATEANESSNAPATAAPAEDDDDA